MVFSTFEESKANSINLQLNEFSVDRRFKAEWMNKYCMILT